MEKAEVTTEKPKRRTAAKTAEVVEAAPKKTASKAKKDPQISPEIRHSMIADAAYYRAEKFGSEGSADDLAHWLAAEAEIEAMLRQGGLSS